MAGGGGGVLNDGSALLNLDLLFHTNSGHFLLLPCADPQIISAVSPACAPVLR